MPEPGKRAWLRAMWLSAYACSNHVPRITIKMRTGPTNPYLKTLIRELKQLSREQNVNIWKRVAEDLSKSTRQRRVVNLSRINTYTKANETVIVPGKVLASGELDHKVEIAAFQFSEAAKKKVKTLMKIQELMKKNPKGKKVRIIG